MIFTLRIVLFFTFTISIYAQQYNAVIYNGSGASTQDKLLAMTLAGIVNRDSAKLYLLNVYETWSYNQTDEKWRDLYQSRGNVVFENIQSIAQLIDKFRHLISGGISYDPNRTYSNFSGQSFRWQAEYAALIGGLTDRLPVTTSMATQYNLTLVDSVLIHDSFDGDSSIWVTGRIESSANEWNNTSLTEEKRYLTMLNWGVEKLLPRCNPSKFYIREITDFTVQKKMFQVNLAGTNSLDLNSMPVEKADILENVLIFLQSKNPTTIFHIYGWIRPEPMTQWFAFFGSSFHETLLGNLSWHSSFPVLQTEYYPKSKVNPDTVNLENKYYILFVGSEGDASNWVIGFQSGAWLSAQRGNVPIGWGWNFHLLNECPFIASYYYDTATKNDGFLTVTSPLGYAYPDLWQSDVWQGAIDSTKYLIQKFNVEDFYGYKHYAGSGIMTYRGKTISNSFNFTKYGQFQSAIGAKLTMLFDPQLASQVPITHFGTLMLNHVNDGSFYGDASDLTAMANRIITNIKKQNKPGFLLAGYQRFRQDEFSSRPSPSSSDVSIPRLIQVVNLIKADPEIGSFVEVVTPEMFSVLMHKKLTGIEEETSQNPKEFVLHQNYPNPFNPATTINYNLPLGGFVSLKVYDMLGKEVAVLVNEVKSPGNHFVQFNSNSHSGLPSGVYIYKLFTENYTASRKMLLLK